MNKAKPSDPDADAVTLSFTARDVIRRALLIGLDSYCEMERLVDKFAINERADGREMPEVLKPLHPTGASDTVSDFASALRFL